MQISNILDRVGSTRLKCLDCILSPNLFKSDLLGINFPLRVLLAGYELIGTKVVDLGGSKTVSVTKTFIAPL